MVELTLVGVRVELPANQPIVLLKERQGERFLPIWIGAFEATAIAFALQGIETARPMTHDLMKNILEETGMSMEKVVISDLKEGTFYADITLAKGVERFEISSRPSDAIALAVRMSVPIFSEETVLSEASVFIELEEDDELERFRDFLKDVKPEDFA
ncbi:MAG: bifunctional nuclease family protein [Candidatus Geothermincolia bacterium]